MSERVSVYVKLVTQTRVVLEPPRVSEHLIHTSNIRDTLFVLLNITI